MESNASSEGSVSFVVACDVCGQPVTQDDYFQAELTAGGATCPTALTVHRACYEAASALWVPEAPDSTCNYDPLFPETGQWNRMQQDQEPAPGDPA
jgi:hypothetical protein